jgi:hypothetical protein
MIRALAVVLTIFSLGAEAQPAEPLGMVLDVQGAVTATEGGKASRVEMLSYLRPGMDLEVAAGASLAATWYAGSKELRFAGPARLKVLRDRVQVVQGGGASERSLGEEKVAASKSPRLAQATIMMRSFSHAAPPPAPGGAERVEKLRPAEGAGFSDWMLYAMALEDAGLREQARPVWKKLAAERPGEPRLRQFADR